MPKIDINMPIEGGNCFLGKKTSGEYFALIGNKNLCGNDIPFIAKHLGIKGENVHLIPQPDFHIDLGIRPLNYPYVLLGDRKLTANLILAKYKLDNSTKLLIETEGNFLPHDYAGIDKIEHELRQKMFIPIRVPGILGDNQVNYMNAIVHQESKGDLIYITNDCQPSCYKNIDINSLFKEYLMKQVPQIKKVEFISGGSNNNSNAYGTYMNFALARTGGGIHCMTSERPDFVKWNAMA